MMRAVLCLVLVIALSVAAEAPPVDVGVEPRLGALVPPELRLIDHSGAELTLGQVLGEVPTVLVPAYYRCPMLCGLNLNSVQTAAMGIRSLHPGKDYRLLALSFDPEDDAQRAESRRHGLAAAAEDAPPWRFAVIHPEDRDELLRAIGWRVERDPQSGEYAHPAGSLVLSADGHVSQQLMGLETRSEDLRLALVEAGDGAIGSPLDQLLLLCYHYDPATRKYGLVLSNFYRLGGVVIMLLSGLGMWFMVRRVRRRHA